MLATITQCPTDLGCVGFRPPAVQLRKIDTAVHEHFHAARTAGLPRPARRVEPHIGPLYQVLRQQHVVVAEENDMPTRLRVADKLNPLADERLPRLIRRMRLARHDELHGALGIGEDLQQPLRVVQQQVRPFVRCEPAREGDCQHIGIEHLARDFRLAGSGPRGREVTRDTLACIFDEILTRRAAKLPQLHGIDREDAAIVRRSSPPTSAPRRKLFSRGHPRTRRPKLMYARRS